MNDFRFPHRVRRLRDLFCATENRAEVDAFLVTDLENARYLTGFSGSNALCIVTQTDAVFLTDSRYGLQSETEVCGWERVVLPSGSNLAHEAASVLERLGAKQIGFESDLLTVAALDDLKSELKAGQMVPRPATVQILRRIKDKSEIAALRKAFAVADLCVEWIVQNAQPGQTEREIAWGMESFMRHTHGAERLSFPSIVASGPNSALIHGRASDRILGASGEAELLLCDFGCVVDGYCSDITRTFIVGESTSKHREVYQAVFAAQQAACAAVRPGVHGKDIDTIARDILTEAGWGEAFAHSTGHGVGRVVHDHPAFSQKSTLVLEPGMVVTVEPGAYLSGFGGVRIEDVLLVTEQGHEYLTHAPRTLRSVGSSAFVPTP